MKHSIKLAAMGLVLFSSLLCPVAPAQAAGMRSASTNAALPVVCFLWVCCTPYGCESNL